MRKNKAFRVAASTLAIGMVTAGCTSTAYRPATFAHSASDADKDAGKSYARAGVALQQGKQDEALAHIEKAVEMSPRDVGYRMVLGDLYLKNGRFLSAEQAFSDVLTLNPGNTRASMSVALSKIAQGRNAEALQVLDGLAALAAAEDLGLAYALAGQPQRAIAMLEPVARTAEATGRTRQNLALAYALAGEWQRARITAAQDVSPAELGERLQQWAALAQPQAPHSQVAALLGISEVVADAGQPAQLALAPDPVIVAEAPAPVAVEAARVEAPVSVRSAPVLAAPPIVAAPVRIAASPAPATPRETLAEATRIEAPAAVEAPVVAERKMSMAVQTLVKAEPAVIRASANAAPAASPLPTFKPARQRASFEPIRARQPSGRFVVQIGAYKNQLQAERAWVEAQHRYSIADREPLSTTVAIPGKGTFHRLSVSGFDNAGEATRLCRAIKAKGGACFVRSSAGDAPVQWASRPAGRRG
ncbi:MAG TPA: tetratricopeptide repeat protein [Allosphingosinicella sp.]|jgi:Flp pilus assembly protein TadD